MRTLFSFTMIGSILATVAAIYTAFSNTFQFQGNITRTPVLLFSN
jgi:hypothetical protein